MNYTHYFTLLSLLLGFGAQAQKHSVRLHIGSGLTNVTQQVLNPSDGLGDRANWGFSTEITYQYHFKKPFYVGIGFAFADKGFATEIDLTDREGELIGTGEETIHTSYTAIPIHIGATFGAPYYFRADYALVPSWLSKATLESSIISNQEVDISESLDSFDLGHQIQLGVGRNFSKRLAIDLSIALQQSFTALAFGKFSANADQLDYYHQELKLMAGVTYKIK